jgi:hypothetical protein
MDNVRHERHDLLRQPRRRASIDNPHPRGTDNIRSAT